MKYVCRYQVLITNKYFVSLRQETSSELPPEPLCRVIDLCWKESTYLLSDIYNPLIKRTVPCKEINSHQELITQECGSGDHSEEVIRRTETNY